MPKKQIIVWILLLSLVLPGCKSSKQKNNIPPEADLTYPVSDATAYCVAPDNSVYVYSESEGKMVEFNSNGVRKQEWIFKNFRFHAMCYGADHIFAFVSDPDEDKESMQYPFLIKISKETGHFQEIHRNNNCNDVYKIIFQNNTLYFLERELTAMEEDMNFSDPGYLYLGEHLRSYSLKTETVAELPIDLVRTFSKESENRLSIFAYDRKAQSFYFSCYNTDTHTISEKQYVSEEFDSYLQCYDYDDQSKRIIYGDDYRNTIIAIDPSDVTHSTNFYAVSGTILLQNHLTCQDGRVYYIADGTLYRFKISNYLKNNTTIRVLSDTKSYEFLNGTGFEFEFVDLSTESLTTAILAADPEYDLWLFSTDSPLAEQVRRVGAYAPLNEIEGIRDYLKSCFACMEDAATNQNGEIWMLPCELDTEIFLYQPKLCETLGFHFEERFSYQKIADLLLALNTDDREKENMRYELPFFRENRNVFQRYLTWYAGKRQTANFNTPIFRSCAELFYQALHNEKLTNAVNKYISPAAELSLYQKSEEEIDLAFEEYFQTIAAAILNRHELMNEHKATFDGSSHNILNYDFFKVCAMPPLAEDGNEKSIGHAYILVLNPNSKNLKDAKEFLETYASMLMQEESIFRTRNLRKAYTRLEQEVHEIYADSQIVFAYPPDVFESEFQRYLNGTITLENLIPELERRLNIYLKE